MNELESWYNPLFRTIFYQRISKILFRYSYRAEWNVDRPRFSPNNIRQIFTNKETIHKLNRKINRLKRQMVSKTDTILERFFY